MELFSKLSVQLMQWKAGYQPDWRIYLTHQPISCNSRIRVLSRHGLKFDKQCTSCLLHVAFSTVQNQTCMDREQVDRCQFELSSSQFAFRISHFTVRGLRSRTRHCTLSLLWLILPLLKILELADTYIPFSPGTLLRHRQQGQTSNCKPCL